MKRAAIVTAILAAILAEAPPAEARGGRRCRESASVPVIGRARCHRFGKWDATPEVFAEALSVALELDWHRLLLARRTLDADLTLAGKTTTFALPATATGLSRLDVASFRLAPEVVRLGPLRVGPVFEIGGAGVTAPSFLFQGGWYTVTGAVYGNLGINLAAGLKAGPLFLRAEALAGVSGFHLDTTRAGVVPQVRGPRTAPQGFPWGSGTGGGSSGAPPPDGLALSESRFRLAPRVSVAAWASDHVTLGVAGAMDVIHRDDFSLGAFARFYYDPYGVHDPRLP